MMKGSAADRKPCTSSKQSRYALADREQSEAR